MSGLPAVFLIVCLGLLGCTHPSSSDQKITDGVVPEQGLQAQTAIQETTSDLTSADPLVIQEKNSSSNAQEQLAVKQKTSDLSPEDRRNLIALSWPLSGGRISRGFNPASKKPHIGIDIVAPRGTPILAAHDGMVIYTGSSFKGYGKLVIIEFADRWATLYSHLSKILVRQGQRVRRSQKIGVIGRTGRATGIHLHFEIRYKRQPIDPYVYLPRTAPFVAYYH